MRHLLLPPVLAAALSFPAAAQAPSTKAPEAYWEGEWDLVTADSDQVEARIDTHVKDLNLAMRLYWKHKLQNACKTYPRLDILIGTVFSATLGKELPADAPTDGTSAEWTRSDGEKFKVSMKREDPSITQVFAGKGYSLTYAYALGQESGTLDLRVTYASPKLSKPFSYQLRYRKQD
jgi:hypothetical protein